MDYTFDNISLIIYYCNAFRWFIKQTTCEPIIYTNSKKYASAAENAVDRNFSTCTRTKSMGTNSPEKKVWWKVDLGALHNIHSVQIMFKNYNMEGMGIDILWYTKKFGVEVLILSLNHNGYWEYLSNYYQKKKYISIKVSS